MSGDLLPIPHSERLPGFTLDARLDGDGYAFTVRLDNADGVTDIVTIGAHSGTGMALDGMARFWNEIAAHRRQVRAA